MADPAIFIGLGANLPSPAHGPPEATLAAALERLDALGLRVSARSRWYESAPVPASDQPWYLNAVARLETALDPAALLALLHRVEAEFGRVRGARNAPRLIDLDLLAYGDRVATGGAAPLLPHPRMHERAFVLLPLREIAPDWRHPLLGRTVGELIRMLPPGQIARPRAAS
ncbi:MAG TPA: 2-amino-4-hydroxy-6-hydroxymethyldihydropteridine diphosphokinase [Stellaceae bacterium]|nr:2-amino-4-hydroxy-6-hydroxymethyldihydropteridine diphosphokinase [Stellaceae bacterium]